jgi:hypothetical protein
MKTMKNKIPYQIALLLALYSQVCHSQAKSLEAEVELNSKLMQNSKTALEQQKPNTATSEMRTFTGSQKLSNGIDPKNLSDQDKQLSETYIHHGLANQIYKENCSGDMQAVCGGQEGKHKFMGMDPGMVKALTQGYAMIMAMGDLASISKSPAAVAAEQAKADEVAKAAGNKAEKVSEKADDYCKYIPTMTEGIATFTQMAVSKELSTPTPTEGETAQKDSLLKAAKSHESRAKMAQIQAAGWWGGAACYAVNAANPTGWAVNKNLVIKLGAATLLGAFYQNEVSANKEYAAKTRKIADSLPSKGDCNPITDNLCFCSQPSTQNHPTYCAQGLHAKNMPASSYRVACTNDQLKIDAKCQCETNNSCFDSFLDTQSAGTLQLGLGHANSPFKGVRSLARGELVGGAVGSSAYDRTSAIARKALQELSNKVPLENSLLTKDQKSVVDAMVSQGIPLHAATLMAQNPPTPSAMASSAAKFNGSASGGKNFASLAPQKPSSVVDFSGGSGLGYKGNSKDKSNSDVSDLFGKLKPTGKNPTNAKLVEFAQKAEDRARQSGQIRKDDGTHLFDIISMRYQTSGRRLLEIDASK